MIAGFLPERADEVEALDRIIGIAREECGINLHDGKRAMVRTRLGKRLRQLDLDLSGYLALVVEDPLERRRLVDLITTNHTHFWREPAHFDHLVRNVLVPARERGQETLRIWCCGCASGEEAWSLALMVREAFPVGHPCDAAILATDISTKALSQARAGDYPESRVEPLPPLMRSRLLAMPDRATRRYAVLSEFRPLVHFARLNLFDPWPMKGPYDAIFCRNVMIYFTKEIQASLVERMVTLLKPGGLLYLGHSESLTRVQNPLKAVDQSVYVKP